MALKDWFKSATGSYFRKDREGSVVFHKKGDEIEVVGTITVPSKFTQQRTFCKTKLEAKKVALNFMRTH